MASIRPPNNKIEETENQRDCKKQDLTVRLPNAANPRLASIHREAINRAQQILGRLAEEANALSQQA